MPPFAARAVGIIALISTATFAPPGARGNPADGTWSPIPGPLLSGPAVYDPVRDRMVRFDAAGTWTLPLGAAPAWQALATAGTPPPRPTCAVFDAARDRILVLTEDPLTGGRLLFALALGGTPNWTQLSGTLPPDPPTSSQSLLYDAGADRALLVVSHFESGCCLYTTYSLHVWQLPLAGSIWSELFSIDDSEQGRIAAWDPVRRRVMLFGGVIHYYAHDGFPAFDIFSNQVITLDVSGTPAWAQTSVAGPSPDARVTDRAFYDPVRDRLVILGGGGYSGNTSDTWALSLGNTPAWSQLASASEATGSSGVAIYDPARDRALTHVGVSLYALSLGASPAWTRILPQQPLPPSRSGASVVIDPLRRRMLMFGGFSNSFLNDVWALALGGPPGWTPLAPAGPLPPGRAGHSAIYDAAGDRMIVFGGDSFPGGSFTGYYSDAWSLSLSGAPVWTSLAPADTVPPARYAHSAIYDPVRQRMVIFGGYDNTYRNDTWSLSLAGAPAWTPLNAAGAPSPRWGHVAIYEPADDAMLIEGGAVSTFPYSTNDAALLRLSGVPQWTPLAATGTPPPADAGDAAVYDPSRARMVVAGGFGNQFACCSPRVGRTFALSFSGGARWSELLPEGAFPASQSQSAVYDPWSDRMMLYAGATTWTLNWSGAPTAVLISLVAADAGPDGVHVAWWVDGASGRTATVERREGDGPWQAVGEATADGTGAIAWEDRSVSPGLRYGYRLALAVGDRMHRGGEVTVDVSLAPRLGLECAGPNPALGAPELWVSLPGSGSGRLELLDAAGRSLASRDPGGWGVGRHRVALEPGRSLAPGLYFVRLRFNGERRELKVAVMR